jgi:hypothetical protein
MVLGVPVVRLLYERGRFTPADTQATAAALLLYSLGLVGYTGVKVLAPAFYALGRPRVPLLASVSAVATNLLAILLLHGALGFRAIALGTALGSLVNAGLLVGLFEKRVGGLFGHGLFRPIARMALAAAVMAGLAWLAAAGLERLVGTRGLGAQLATGLLPVVAGVGLYVLLTHALRVGEAEVVWRMVRDRLRRGDRSPACLAPRATPTSMRHATLAGFACCRASSRPAGTRAAGGGGHIVRLEYLLWSPQPSGQLQKGLGDVEGTLLDVEADLGLGEGGANALRGTLRLGGSWKLRGSWSPLEFRGDVTAGQPFVYGTTVVRPGDRVLTSLPTTSPASWSGISWSVRRASSACSWALVLRRRRGLVNGTT